MTGLCQAEKAIFIAVQTLKHKTTLYQTRKLEDKYVLNENDTLLSRHAPQNENSKRAERFQKSFCGEVL